MESDENPEAASTSTNARSGLIMSVLVAAVLVVGVATTVYSTRVWWMPPLASATGSSIDSLMMIFLVLSGIVFLGVQGALAFFVYRFRQRDGYQASHWHESSRLEIAWTVTPAVILVILTVVGGVVYADYLNPSTPAVAEGDTVVVEVTAQQFGWNIRYPGSDGEFGRTTPDLIGGDNNIGLDPEDPAAQDDIVFLSAGSEPEPMVVPAGKEVHVRLRSRDVIHSFFLPNFRVKQDAVPGRTIPVRFIPEDEGTYEIACAELCGTGHWAMKGSLQVVSQREYEEWLETAAQDQAEE